MNLKKVTGKDRINASSYAGLNQFYAYKNKSNANLYGIVIEIRIIDKKVRYETAAYDGTKFTKTGNSYTKAISTFKNLYRLEGAISAISLYAIIILFF